MECGEGLLFRRVSGRVAYIILVMKDIALVMKQVENMEGKGGILLYYDNAQYVINMWFGFITSWEHTVFTQQDDTLNHCRLNTTPPW